MEIFYPIVIFYIQFSLAIEGAEYVEAPFQKYGVILTQNKVDINSREIIPMMLYGEKFICGVPSEEEILSARTANYPGISVLTERINAMPCFQWRIPQWVYVICENIIYRFHKRNYTQDVLGVKYSDNYSKKKLEGFWGKGKQTIFTRHFTCNLLCSSSKKDVKIIVWYFCRQSEEEKVVFLQEMSPFEYEIWILTPRVCSSIYESETGYQLLCYSKTDAKLLVILNEDYNIPPRHSFGYRTLDSTKNFGGGILFVINANIKANEEYDYEKDSNLFSEEICEKKSAYRSEEIISNSMGFLFKDNLSPQNQSRDSIVYPFYQEASYHLVPLDIITETLKKVIKNIFGRRL